MRLNLVWTHACPLASNHMGVSPSASLVILMLVGTCWLLRRGTNFLVVPQSKEAVSVSETSCRSVGYF